MAEEAGMKPTALSIVGTNWLWKLVVVGNCVVTVVVVLLEGSSVGVGGGLGGM